MIERKGHKVLVVTGEGVKREKNGSYRCFFDNRQEIEARTAQEGRALAKKFIAKNMVVIVRPQYNEITRQRGRFLREWRSIDGKPFKEIVWKMK
jgi:hypothetical protein